MYFQETKSGAYAVLATVDRPISNSQGTIDDYASEMVWQRDGILEFFLNRNGKLQEYSIGLRTAIESAGIVVQGIQPNLLVIPAGDLESAPERLTEAVERANEYFKRKGLEMKLKISETEGFTNLERRLEKKETKQAVT